MKKLVALILLLLLSISLTAQVKIGGTAKVGGTAKTSVGVGCSSFPCNPVLANFNQANEGPPITGWSQTNLFSADTRGFQISSNVAQNSVSSSNADYWNAGTFGAKQEAYVSIAVKGSGSDSTGVLLRLTNPASSSITGYLIIADANTSIFVYRIDNSTTIVQVGSTFTQTITNGDSMGASIDGSTITVYYKVAAGSWTSLGTRTDATYSSAGFIGMWGDGGSIAQVKTDDFGGGAY